ncbi:hypothetical protein [Chitinophaga arvensicola]|uniref:Uncharacterized protein n=1 Tax=Chitinophaga arvensicola TaxID=29529 RepID=A0A1I0R9L9_9BACT|nr:hypothetical protein [Chitinophaga arvensicola]SEW37484.1 hypothetical protein SAMN04488122_2512 [Chitinophaga arvensicola]
MITIDILDQFERITGKNIRLFFSKALDFFSTDCNLLIAYYSGNVREIKSDPFATLTALEDMTQTIFAAFHAHGARLTNTRWWYVLDEVEQIDSRLKTIRNIHRWARSTRSGVAYTPGVEMDYTIPAGQTLERISRDVLGDNTPQDEWADIAVSNYLREEDYTPGGGVNIRLRRSSVSGNVVVNAVVDAMDGQRIVGKDLHRSISFLDNDLKCLSYEDTVRQSVEILATLKRNDNPYVPDCGLQSAVVVGANRASLNFPIIVRQMTATFATDDTLKDFSIQEIKVESDNLLINYQVTSRLNETIDGSILI